MKKQNQETKFTGSETDPDKIYIHVWIFNIAEYLGPGNDREERCLKSLYVKNNISCLC